MFSSHWWDGPNLPGISVPLTAPGADLRPVGAFSRRAIGGWNHSWKRGFWRWKSMNLKEKKVNNLICKKKCDFIPYYFWCLWGLNIGRGWDYRMAADAHGLISLCFSGPFRWFRWTNGGADFSGCPEIEIPWVASVSESSSHSMDWFFSGKS